MTGMAGFLGSNVAERFLNLGWEVAGIDNLVGVTRLTFSMTSIS